MELYTGQLKSHKWQSHKEIKNAHKKNRKETLFNDSIITFDIEVTSAWLEDGQVIGYRPGLPAEYWNELQPVALCYLWQCSVDGRVFYGREIESAVELFDDIPTSAQAIVWVHNLSYEFQFLKNIVTWTDVFARSAHKPMKAVCNEYPHITFRCSYMLTRLSLAAWGKQLGIPKHVGDLDYEAIRTPLTPLTEKELAYGEYDCLIVEAGIKKFVQTYGTQDKIPLTQTGTVRLETKNRFRRDKSYPSFIQKLVPKNADEYKRLQRVFAGGYTHANRWYAGEKVTGLIEHYDFASSYPTVMVAEKYPMTPWVYMGTGYIPDPDSFDDCAWIMELTFSQLNSVSCNTYIQGSKAAAHGAELDNGRVLHADELTIWVTEQDFITISNNYTWESLEYGKVYRSKKDYLPKLFVEYILELYKNKTTLKDVEGMEDLYMQSKQFINSMYGMSVTAIVQAEVKLVGDEWVIEPLTADYVNEKLGQLRGQKASLKYFLSYSWGCWVTAYARRNLWSCIESCDDEMIYCDTDSIFVLGKHDFTWYNKQVTEKLRKACEYHGIDFEMTRPRTPKGKQKPLGVFAAEDNCTEFITLGAKRYVERREHDGKLHLTVSGINKGAVDLLNDDMENFTDGFDFDKDAPCVSKRLSTYVDDMPPVKWPDGYVSGYKHGINMRRTGYKLTMTDEYKDLIGYELKEAHKMNMRGRFING